MSVTEALIVVGAGTAGMACAIAAADAGAVVRVAEQACAPGGTLHLTGGHLSAAGTRRQRERGIDDSPDLHLADIERISGGTADPALARLAVDLAADTVEWLLRLGLRLADETPAVYYGHEPYTRPRTVWGDDRGRSILRVLEPRWEEHVRSGRIRFLAQHALSELIVENGRVTGVVARTPSCSVELRGAGTVLATGGYAANRALIAAVTPGAPRVLTAASSASQGDGIAAAQRIGARFHRADTFMPSLGSFARDVEAGRAWDSPEFMDLARMPHEIWVNASGERFTPEDVLSPDLHERALARQPGSQLWVVCDEQALAGPGGTFHRTWDAARLREEAAREVIGWAAPDVGGLAAKAGIDPAGLARTVERWNGFVRAGRDGDHGRTHLAAPLDQPPYYAFRSDATSFVSFGGLAVDGELRVLDEAGTPIPGLYAAGEIIGAGATCGNAFCSGMLLTPALAFGRLLGTRLAAEVEAANLRDEVEAR